MSEFSACYVCSDIITDHELLDNITIINELCKLESSVRTSSSQLNKSINKIKRYATWARAL